MLCRNSSLALQMMAVKTRTLGFLNTTTPTRIRVGILRYPKVLGHQILNKAVQKNINFAIQCVYS